MQVDAYIQSLCHHTGVPASRIHILYAESPGISYRRAIARHPDVHWVAETSFSADLRRLVEEGERYILLGCDDVIFCDSFDVNAPLGRLERDADLFGFSLRLGLNLHSLPNLTRGQGVLSWPWASAPTGHWSYPWDVSASIYRRDFVLSILDGFGNLSNPNRFEAFAAEALAAGKFPARPTLASFERSKAVTLTINRVQDEYANEFDGQQQTSPQDLYDAYEAGQEIDWARLASMTFRRIHIDSRGFSLTDSVTPPSKRPVGRTGAAPTHGAVPFKAQVMFWRILNIAKEVVRRFLPRPLLAALRKLL